MSHSALRYKFFAKLSNRKEFSSAPEIGSESRRGFRNSWLTGVASHRGLRHTMRGTQPRFRLVERWTASIFMSGRPRCSALKRLISGLKIAIIPVSAVPTNSERCETVLLVPRLYRASRIAARTFFSSFSLTGGLAQRFLSDSRRILSWLQQSSY